LAAWEKAYAHEPGKNFRLLPTAEKNSVLQGAAIDTLLHFDHIDYFARLYFCSFWVVH
jgi:hypothetical protein